jgi:type IV secretory pathway VirJ component
MIGCLLNCKKIQMNWLILFFPLYIFNLAFSVQANWMPQFKEVFTKIAEKSNKTPQVSVISLSDLPIVERPASGIKKEYLALLLTGDGGYGETDRGISNGLAENGIQTVVLNSLHYFWKKRTPQETAKDVERILQYYLATSNNDKIILIGYSFGADVLPFVFNLLPKTLQDKVDLIAYIGLGKTASFQFHLTNWIGLSSCDDDLPIRPELEKLGGKRMLCFYGKKDKNDLCPELDETLTKQIMHSGGHRVRKDFLPIVKAILAELQ